MAAYNHDFDIDKVNLELVSTTQIVDHIGRHGLALSRLVDEILTAEGYRTHISSFGPDGSVEVLADRAVGPFGFGLPRIAALVKTSTDIADPDLDELEAFIGRSGAWNGLPHWCTRK
jgi:hypothetical protein